MTVRVIRVTEELQVEQEVVEFDTIFQPDPELALDNRFEAQSGQPGIIQRTIRVRFENGAEISRAVEDESEIQPVRDRIVNYGTRVVIRTLDTPDGPVEYWRVLQVYATSYHPRLWAATISHQSAKRCAKASSPSTRASSPITPIPMLKAMALASPLIRAGRAQRPTGSTLATATRTLKAGRAGATVYLLTPAPENINYLLPESPRGGRSPDQNGRPSGMGKNSPRRA